MHVLGFDHEENRFDRDAHLDIKEDNVQRGEFSIVFGPHVVALRQGGKLILQSILANFLSCFVRSEVFVDFTF